MNVTPEERQIIDKLQNECAINISQAFKLFLKQMVKEKQNEKE